MYYYCTSWLSEWSIRYLTSTDGLEFTELVGGCDRGGTGMRRCILLHRWLFHPFSCPPLPTARGPQRTSLPEQNKCRQWASVHLGSVRVQ